MGESNPTSRKEDLVVQELNGEILIYDLRENKAFCLNETSAVVWQACDGNKTVVEIGKELGNEDLVWLALADLKKQKLVDHKVDTPLKFMGMSRRDVIKKIGIGSMVALPVVSALVAPESVYAQGSCGTACANPGDCPVMACSMCSGTLVCVA